MRKLLNSTLFLGLSLALAISAGAEESLKERLGKSLATVLPDTSITAVRPSGIAGLYEVMVGPDVLYMSGDGRYVFRGDLYDLKSRVNLSANTRAKARISAFDELGVKNTIEFAPGDGETRHVLYVYTDIDCAYCRKFHKQVGELNQAGIAVRYLAFPRAGLGSKSYKKFVSVMCAPDRKAALTRAKLGAEMEERNCDNPVAREYRLGLAMGVKGTPTLITEDGQELGGYIPAANLIQMYKAAM